MESEPIEEIEEDLADVGVDEIDHEVDNEQATEALALAALLLFRRRVNEDLFERLGGLSRIRGRGRDLSGRSTTAQESTIRRAQSFGRDAIGDVERDVTRGIRRLSRIEAEYQIRRARRLGRDDQEAPGSLTTEQARQLGRNVPVLGRDLAEAFRRLAEGFGERVAEAIRLGIERGDSVDDIVAAVVTNLDSVTVKAERDIRRVVVTARTSANAGTRLRLAETFPGTWDRIQHISVLDSRTSAICVERSGSVYEVGSVFPVPPLHWNCRSTLRLIRVGDEPLDLPTGDEYLRSVSRRRQNEILGRAGADAWRGGRPVSRLVTPALRPISAAELRRRNRRRGS